MTCADPKLAHAVRTMRIAFGKVPPSLLLSAGDVIRYLQEFDATLFLHHRPRSFTLMAQVCSLSFSSYIVPWHVLTCPHMSAYVQLQHALRGLSEEHKADNFHTVLARTHMEYCSRQVQSDVLCPLSAA